MPDWTNEFAWWQEGSNVRCVATVTTPYCPILSLSHTRLLFRKQFAIWDLLPPSFMSNLSNDATSSTLLKIVCLFKRVKNDVQFEFDSLLSVSSVFSRRSVGLLSWQLNKRNVFGAGRFWTAVLIVWLVLALAVCAKTADGAKTLPMLSPSMSANRVDNWLIIPPATWCIRGGGPSILRRAPWELVWIATHG